MTGGSEEGGGQFFAVWRQCGGMVENWGPAWPWQLRLPTVMHPAGRGQGLSPAVSTPIGFHGSSLICRICHCRGEFLLGGFNPCCHGSQASSPPYGYFGLSLSVSLSFLIQVQLSFLLYHSLALRSMPSLSFHFCLSTVCLQVEANLRGRILRLGGVGVLWSKRGVWEGRGFCLFGQMHRPISELLSVIKGADDVEQIHGPCLISPCFGPHLSSWALVRLIPMTAP